MLIELIASRAREIAETGQLVEPGGQVTVSDKLGAALCEQSDVWREATKTAPKGAGKES